MNQEETRVKRDALFSYSGPTLRLAYSKHTAALFSLRNIDNNNLPGMLVNYPYSKTFNKIKSTIKYRDWVMDSGAFSVWSIGEEIDINKYIEDCKYLMRTDPTLVEIFALDVIGNWKGSLKNAETMWNAGVPAIPCYHYGEPEEALLEIAKTYPKIAIGGTVGLDPKRKRAFFKACFSRIWPKKVHGFGIATADLLLGFPFHSVDASSWSTGPCKFGNWKRFGNLSVRKTVQDLRGEIISYVELEIIARQKWKKQMELLEEISPFKELKTFL